NAPHLRRAVVGGLLLRLALAVADEVNRLPVAAPLGVAVVGTVAGEPPRGALAVGDDDPQVGLAGIIDLVPAALAIGDELAVGRDGDLGDRREREVVVGGDVVRPLLRGRDADGDEEKCNDEISAMHYYSVISSARRAGRT